MVQLGSGSDKGRSSSGGGFFLSALLTHGVLVPPVELDVDGGPGLGVDEVLEVSAGHDVSLVRLAETAGRGIGELREDPHATEGNTRPEAGCGFGDKTSATGAKHAKDLAHDGFAVRNDKEEARDDNGVDVAEVGRKRVGIAAAEIAVEQAAPRRSALGAKKKIFREVYAGGLQLRIFVGEAAGVEAGPAANFENMGAWGWAIGGKQRLSDLSGVIAEEILAAESVKPRTSFKEALWLMDKGFAGQLAVACFHSMLTLSRFVRLGPTCGVLTVVLVELWVRS
jgi:hypothetical protein